MLLLALLTAGCGAGTTAGPASGARCPGVPELNGRIPNDNQCEFIDFGRDSSAWATVTAWVNAITGSGGEGLMLLDSLSIVACVAGRDTVLYANDYVAPDEIEGDTYLLRGPGRPDSDWFRNPEPGVQLYGTRTVIDTLGAHGVLIVRPADRVDCVFHLWNREEADLTRVSAGALWARARVRVVGDARVQFGFDFRRTVGGSPTQGGQSGWLAQAEWRVITVPLAAGCR